MNPVSTERPEPTAEELALLSLMRRMKRGRALVTVEGGHPKRVVTEMTFDLGAPRRSAGDNGDGGEESKCRGRAHRRRQSIDDPPDQHSSPYAKATGDS